MPLKEQFGPGHDQLAHAVVRVLPLRRLVVVAPCCQLLLSHARMQKVSDGGGRNFPASLCTVAVLVSRGVVPKGGIELESRWRPSCSTRSSICSRRSPATPEQPGGGSHWSGYMTAQYEEGQRTRIAHMRHRLFPSVRRWSDSLQLLRLLPDTMTGDGLELLAKQAHALVPPRVAVVVVSLVPGPLGGRGRGGRKE